MEYIEVVAMYVQILKPCTTGLMPTHLIDEA